MYLYHIVKNHSFNDANKRTAYLVTLIFLEANEAPIVFNPKDLEEVVVFTAQGKMEKDEISLFLETGKLSKRN